MFRKTAALAALLLFAAQAFTGEGDPNVGPGGATGNDGVYRPGKIDRLAQGGNYWLYSGRVPMKYKLLNLTDEQDAAIEAVAKEAREAFMDMQKETRRIYKETRDASVYREQHKKTEELRLLYETRIKDLLTDEQKKLLEKIDELIAERQKEQQKIYQEMQEKIQKMREKFDAKLDEMLTPDQRAKLDELLAPATPTMHHRQGGPLGHRRDGTASQRRDDNKADQVDELF